MSIVVKMNRDYSPIANKGANNNENARKTVDARSLKVGDRAGLIDAKKENARNKAMKLISDAWGRDEEATKMREKLGELKKEAFAEYADWKGKVEYADVQKAELKEKYGITNDSAEQKDLELLTKYQNNMMGVSQDEFSEEEIERLKELQTAELTDYQKEAISINRQQVLAKQEMRTAESKLISLTQNIKDAKVDQLKSQDMLNAANAAEDIMEAANKEIKGLLIQDGIDEVNEKAEETAEQIKENGEKREEQEERIEEAKEERKEQEEIIENSVEKDRLDMNTKASVNTASQVKDAQVRIQKIMDENNMISEDIKGIKIDVLASLAIPDVPLESQQKIVATLDKEQNILVSQRSQLSALDDLIKARFVEMFGDPVSNPMRWETIILEECLERIDNGKSFVCSDKPRTGKDPAVLKLSAATYGDYRPQENKALLDPNQFIDAAEVHAGDLLFTRKNTPELVGMAAYVSKTPPKLMMPDLIFRLVPNERINPVFLWQLINCREFRPFIQTISGGSAKSMSNISKERLGKISIICPPRFEQDKLNPIIQQIDKSKSAIQRPLIR